MLTGLATLPLVVPSHFAVSGYSLDNIALPHIPGELNLVRMLRILAGTYAAMAIPAAAARVHLSIRRIGPRLVGSHLMAGLVPFGLGALFLLLASALFLSTYRGSVACRLLRETSDEARGRIAASLAGSGAAPVAPFGAGVAGQVVIQRVAGGHATTVAGHAPLDPDSLLAIDDTSVDVPLLWDGERLFLRSRADTIIASRAIRVEALVPVDSLRMATVSRILGIPVRATPRFRVTELAGNVQITPGVGPDSAAGGTIDIGPPKPAGRGQLPGGAAIPCLQMRGGTWSRDAIPVLSSAGLVEPLVSLFTVRRDNPLSTAGMAVLVVIAFFFLLAIWVNSTMVFQMGRSVTNAVRGLTGGTAALRRGDLGHRIALEGDDELWSVAASFNGMAEGLERMRAMELESERIEEELRLAHAIQSRLLPAAPPEIPGAELAGTSLAAREVGGDYFDFLPLADGRVGITVADVSGKGAPAALLMSTFRAALRAQDLGGLGPAEVLTRINRFIHESVDPGRFITAFLGLYDPATGELRYANAGHDAPIVIHRGGGMSALDGAGGLILGVLAASAYDEARSELAEGDLVAMVTDGVTEAQDATGDFFGNERLADVLVASRARSCAEVAGGVAAAVAAHSAGCPQSDDITVVLLRRGAAPSTIIPATT